MAKFKSHLVYEEVQLGNGRIKVGKTVWEPIDDAAKIMPIAEESLRTGHWKPKDANEIENAKKRVDATEKEYARKRGDGQ